MKLPRVTKAMAWLAPRLPRGYLKAQTLRRARGLRRHLHLTRRRGPALPGAVAGVWEESADMPLTGDVAAGGIQARPRRSFHPLVALRTFMKDKIIGKRRR